MNISMNFFVLDFNTLSLVLQVHVVEVGPSGDLAPRTLIENIQFTEEESRFDFPMAVHVRSLKNFYL